MSKLTALQIIARRSRGWLTRLERLEVSRAFTAAHRAQSADPKVLAELGIPRPEWALAEIRRVGLPLPGDERPE